MGQSGVHVALENGVQVITLNRPSKLNAFNQELYERVRDELHTAAEKEEVIIAAVTGAGDYFSSGNDLNMFAKMPQDEAELRTMAVASGDMLESFVNAFIDFPKPLVGVVNGPAFGIAATILGLFDLVYASDKATFSFPFVRLGQGPEGCSSYTFPRMMGPARAGELLYLGRKISATEAERLGLVTRVIAHQDLSQIWGEVEAWAKLPPQSLYNCKALVRGANKDMLHEVNRKECEFLVERWSSPECFAAVKQNFLNKKV